jgi:hypothetical protein
MVQADKDLSHKDDRNAPGLENTGKKESIKAAS